MFQYTNSNTGDVAIFDDRHPRLESLENWSCVEVPDDADATARRKQALERAAAEQLSIQEAQATRSASQAVYHEQANQIAAASAVPTGPAVPNVTASHENLAEGLVGGKGVLAGKRPTKLTREQQEAKAAADARKADKSGVLARAKRDQKSGVIQTGVSGKPADTGQQTPASGPEQTPDGSDQGSDQGSGQGDDPDAGPSGPSDPERDPPHPPPGQ